MIFFKNNFYNTINNFFFFKNLINFKINFLQNLFFSTSEYDEEEPPYVTDDYTIVRETKALRECYDEFLDDMLFTEEGRLIKSEVREQMAEEERLKEEEEERREIATPLPEKDQKRILKDTYALYNFYKDLYNMKNIPSKYILDNKDIESPVTHIRIYVSSSNLDEIETYIQHLNTFLIIHKIFKLKEKDVTKTILASPLLNKRYREQFDFFIHRRYIIILVRNRWLRKAVKLIHSKVPPHCSICVTLLNNPKDNTNTDNITELKINLNLNKKPEEISTEILTSTSSDIGTIDEITTNILNNNNTTENIIDENTQKELDAQKEIEVQKEKERQKEIEEQKEKERQTEIYLNSIFY